MTTGQTDGKRSRQKVGRTDETGQGASVFAQLPSEYFGASGVALRFPPLGGNSPPVDMQGRPAKRERSLFSQVLDILEASGPMRICFDDLAGITVDYPELELSLDRLLHNCSYCRLAKVKSTRFRRQGVHDCASNKHATNHLLLKRRRGYEGLCHLGLFDIIEPVIYHGVILGSFYYGQVAVKQWRAKSRAHPPLLPAAWAGPHREPGGVQAGAGH